MKQDFIEEKEALEQLVNELNDKIKELNVDIAKSEEIDRQGAIDYNDIDAWVLNRRQLVRDKETREEYKLAAANPYHGRFDVDEIEDDNTFNSQTYYIGKKSLYLNHKERVIDWKSDFANIFYRSSKLSERNFDIHGSKYILTLRRDLLIKDSQLKTCTTTYDSFDDEISDEIVDSFLIEVLKDKRRDRQLTDIIKTIQYDQNEILRQPYDQNFVVQGCAGSGKTMILLHRLSYLLYNKSFNPSSIKIITPNKFFDKQIDELSKELGLNDIGRFTVEDYYKYLIEMISGMKITHLIESEMCLNHDYLRTIYSKEFCDEIKRTYNLFSNEIYSFVDQTELHDIFRKTGIMLPSYKSRNISTLYNTYNSRLNTLFGAIEDAQKISELETSVLNKSKQILDLKIKLIDERKQISKNNIKLLENFKNDEKSLLLEIKKINEEIKQLKSKQIINSSNKDEILTYKYISENDNEITIKIKNECAVAFNEVKKLQNDLSNVPFYNFFRRNQIQSQLDNVMTKFLAQAEVIVNPYLEMMSEDVAGDVNALLMQKDELDILLKDVKQNISIYSSFILEINKFIDKIDKLDDARKIAQTCRESIFDDIKAISSEFDLMETDLQKDVISLKHLKENLEKRNLKIDVSKISDEDIKMLSSVKEKVEICSYPNIFKNIVQSNLEKLQRQYSIKINRKLYRHMIYLHLLLHSVYYNKPLSHDLLLCIDEAQDMSLSEYELIKSLNRDNCIYNLYGDINQIIYDYESIMDWSDVIDMFNLKVHVLHQNYRNTMQITEYCNKEFNSGILPIGIKGNDVLEFNDITTALKEIVSIKNKDINRRCAVIYCDLNSKILNAIDLFEDKEIFSINTIEDDLIPVLTVPMVKGIEFDVVLVVKSKMSLNEKYISYTRALEELIVCSDDLNTYVDVVEKDDSDTMNDLNNIGEDQQDNIKDINNNVYINLWLDIIKNMENDNTYKPVWGIALLEIIDELNVVKEQIEISFNSIASKILKYYWNQIIMFDLKQSHSKVPVIVQEIQNCILYYKNLSGSNESYLYEEIEEELKFEDSYYNRTIRKIVATLSKDVCWRFMISNKVDLGVYELDQTNKKIIFNFEQIMDLKEFNDKLKNLLYFKWYMLLEKYNKEVVDNSNSNLKDIIKKGIETHSNQKELYNIFKNEWKFIYNDELWEEYSMFFSRI